MKVDIFCNKCLLSFIRDVKEDKMNHFSRDETCVIHAIELKCARHIKDRYPNFKFNAGNDLAAALYVEEFNRQARKDLEELRQDSYNQGWKDAKKKAKKKTKSYYFDNDWDWRFSRW